MQEPWELYGGTAQPAPAGPVVVGTPRPRQAPLRAPQTPDETALDAANRAIAELRADLLRRTSGDPAGDAAVEQRRSAGFYLRARNSDDTFNRLGVGPRGPTAQTIAEAGPENYVNSFTESARQRAESAQRNWIAASLRYESGAAIPPSELETQRRAFFPMPDDSPTTIRQKAQARQDVIEALRIGGGQASNAVPPMPLFEPEPGQPLQEGAVTLFDSPAPNGQTPQSDRIPQSGPIEFGGGPNPVPPGAEAFQRDLQAGINAGAFRTPEDIINFGQGRGFNIDRQQAERAIQARGRNVPVGVAEPEYGPADISAVRGPEANREALMLENTLMSGMPVVGQAGQMIQQSFGPETGNAYLRGAIDVPLMGGADEARALGRSVGPETFDQALASENAVDDYDSENNFSARLGGQLSTGLMLPGAGARRLLPQMGVNALYGGGYGFGSGRGGFENRAGNALAGATIGAAVPVALRGAGAALRGIGRGVNALRGAPQVTPEAQRIAQAAADEQIPVSRPIVDPTSRDRMMHLEASRGSGDLIRTPLANTANAIEQRSGQLGAGGTVEEAGTMGQRIQGAGQRFIQESRGVRDRLYTRAANLAGNATVVARDAVASLDQSIADLGGNANQNAGQIAFLRNVRSDLVDEQGNLIPKTVAQIRDMRTNLRSNVNQAGLTFSQAEGRVLDALTAARGDITRDLAASAPRAVAAYARADAYNTLRHDEIKQVVQRVIGPRNNNLSGEQVWEKFRSMAGPRGNSAGIARLWNRLSADEQRDAAATLAERASLNGDFSAATFIRFADSMSPAATRTVFGPEGAQSIANLRTVSHALQQTEKRLNNSRSGAVSSWREAAGRWRETIGALIGSGGALAAGGGGGAAVASAVGGAAVGMAARSAGVQIRRMSARSLMNPDMSRWLAVGARLNRPQAIRTHIGRLTSIAARDPAIAQEVLGLRQALLRAVNDNTISRAAADEGQDNNRQPNGR